MCPGFPPSSSSLSPPPLNPPAQPTLSLFPSVAFTVTVAPPSFSVAKTLTRGGGKSAPFCLLILRTIPITPRLIPWLWDRGERIYRSATEAMLVVACIAVSKSLEFADFDFGTRLGDACLAVVESIYWRVVLWFINRRGDGSPHREARNGTRPFLTPQ